MKIFQIIIAILAMLFMNANVFAQYPNTQVTNNPNDQSETAIAVSPVNSMNVIGAWNDYRYPPYVYKPAFGISTDGGSTWREDTLSADSVLTGYVYGTNPSVAYDRYGNVFYCYVAMDGSDDGSAIVVAKSSNLGINWTYKKVSTLIVGQDKPWITIDNSGGTYDGRIYVSWTEITSGDQVTTYKILTSYSSDHGGTFSTPSQFEAVTTSSSEPIMRLIPSTDRSTLYPGRILQGSMPAVGPDGEVYIVWLYAYSEVSNYRLSKSTDGGTSWSTPINGPTYTSLFKNYVGNARILPLPSLTVAPNGDLLLAYTDYKSSSDHSYRIKFSQSTNSGANWSTPVIVGEATGWQYFGCASVNQSGRISLGYMHCPNPTGYQPEQETWLATSDDNGATWNNEKISNAYSYPPGLGHYTYEYMGIASIAQNSQVFQLWTDHRSNNDDPYFTSLMDINSNVTTDWNLLSTPLSVNCDNVDCMYFDRIGGAWIYNNGQYQDEGNLGSGLGYWVKFMEDNQLTYRGVPVYKCTLSVAAGWNMIGSLSKEIPASKITLQNTSYASKYFDYTAIDYYSEVDTLKPGKGYWIKVEQNGSLILDIFSTSNTSRSLATIEPPPPPSPPPAPTLYGTTILQGGTRYPKLRWTRSETATSYKLYTYLCEGTLDCFDGAQISVVYEGSDTTFIDDSVPVGTKYSQNRERYYVTASNYIGESNKSNKVIYSTDLDFQWKQHDGENSETNVAIPTSTGLQGNYPNPFNPQTTIYYAIAEDNRVRLTVTNILGQEVKLLVDEYQNAGYKSVTFDAGNLPSGIYYYRLQTGEYTAIKKMLLLK